MNTSFWANYNSTISMEHTTKKYFGKYLYKLVVYAPGGRLIDSKNSISDALEHRRNINEGRRQNWASHWFERQNKDLNNADSLFLEKLRNIRQDKSMGFKLRVEEPHVQIYSNNDIDLQNLVIDHFQHFPRNYITSVSGPKDTDAENALNTGAIIRKKNIGYKYKVILKDGRYSTEAKHNILQYLINLGEDQAMLPKSCFNTMNKSSSYIWNLYFYVNDPAVVTFLNLMYPGMVSNIHELVVLDNK